MADFSATFFLFVHRCRYLFSEENMAKKNIDNLPPQYVLPSDDKELQSFTKRFKSDMMEQVVGSIEYAVSNNLPLIEVFQFKNSDFVITLSEKDYLTNLDNIFSYYMEKEHYEYCPRIVRLRQTLMDKSVQNTDENQTQRKY